MLDLLNIDNGSTGDFLNVMHSLSLVPLISKPTRITDTNATLLDNIFVSCDLNCTSVILISSLSDHLPIFVIIKDIVSFSSSRSESVNIKYRVINEVTIENYLSELSSFDFYDFLPRDSIDDAMFLFDDIIFTLYNKHCPIKSKTVSGRSYNKPWICGEILENIKKRQNLYLLYRMNKVSHLAYKRYSNYVTAIIRRSKRNYYIGRFSQFKCDIKRTWNTINSLLGKSMKRSIVINEMKIDGEVSMDNLKIANSLNDYFSSIASEVDNSIPVGVGSSMSYLTGQFLNSFVFSPVTANDVNATILSLKNKSCDVQSVPVSVLKKISPTISPVFASIINRSIFSGTFPESLKVAKIIPLHKKGAKDDKSNYRPISLLSTYSKIMEKVVYKQVYKYLLKFSILSDDQFGFRSQKSTSLALLHFLHYLYPNLDKGNCVLSIFLDFSKAFDCVNHSILLSKMHHYGFRGFIHEWFRSYLSGRKQYVALGGTTLDLCDVEHGVPQ